MNFGDVTALNVEINFFDAADIYGILRKNPKRSRQMDTNGKGSFTGKVAFVTGAANGIGRAAALAFARERASVVVADVSEKENQETARMIKDLGRHALAVTCDVARNEDVRQALNAAIKTFGKLDFAFEPGARSAWHTYPLGQTLIVTSGCGWMQSEGGPKQEIRPGDVVWCPANEKHWHGATPTTAMTHIAIQEQLNGQVVHWMEKVSDEQYQGGLT
jgi:quercetin dioxygenase-like cupin family protein